MFFLKTEGTDKIPSFVEIRDDDYTIIAHVAISKLEKELQKMELKTSVDSLLEQIKKAPYGKIIQF